MPRRALAVARGGGRRGRPLGVGLPLWSLPPVPRAVAGLRGWQAGGAVARVGCVTGWWWCRSAVAVEVKAALPCRLLTGRDAEARARSPTWPRETLPGSGDWGTAGRPAEPGREAVMPDRSSGGWPRERAVPAGKQSWDGNGSRRTSPRLATRTEHADRPIDRTRPNEHPGVSPFRGNPGLFGCSVGEHFRTLFGFVRFVRRRTKADLFGMFGHWIGHA